MNPIQLRPNARLGLAALLAFSLPAYSNVLRPAKAAKEILLEMGKPIEREIGKGETNIYKIVVRAKHVVSGVVDQHGVDVVVKVIDPCGMLIATIDSPNFTNGPEPWSFEAKRTGTWRLEVSPLAESPQPGRYEARIDEIITSYESAERGAKRHYLSPRMFKLWKEYRAEGSRAITRLAKEMEGHTPLVEPLADDKHGDVLITFIRRVPKNQWAEVGGGPAIPPMRLARFQETDLMYLTRRCPREARFCYAFKLHEQVELEPGPTDFEPDPWNPHRLNFMGGAMKESLIELPSAPKQDWVERKEGLSVGRVAERSIRSQALGEERKLAIYLPSTFGPTNGPYPCVVLLDGECYGHYKDPVIPTPVILDNLIAQKKLPPLLAVLVDSGGTRDRDLAMSERFSEFLAKELMPWVHHEYGASTEPAKVIIAGSSLGGLCAAYTAFHHPEVFGNVLSQSGSFWYAPGTLDDTRGFGRETGALAHEIASSPRKPLRFWMEVGIFEAGEQLQNNRCVREVLLAKGYGLDYHEFAGGHDYACWRGSLAGGLRWLLYGAERIARESHERQ
jgi:enterochelin esterase-like enzyme